MSGFLNTYKFFPVYSYQDGALQWLIKSLSFILFFENLDMYIYLYLNYLMLSKVLKSRTKLISKELPGWDNWKH